MEVRVTKKGTCTGQMTTRVVLLRSKDNVTKTKDRKGKLRKGTNLKVERRMYLVTEITDNK